MCCINFIILFLIKITCSRKRSFNIVCLLSNPYTVEQLLRISVLYWSQPIQSGIKNVRKMNLHVLHLSCQSVKTGNCGWKIFCLFYESLRFAITEGVMMDTNLQHEDLLIKLRSKLNDEKIRLWEAPYNADNDISQSLKVSQYLSIFILLSLSHLVIGFLSVFYNWKSIIT